MTVRESVTLAGLGERAKVARGFVEGVLGAGYPCVEAAVLLVDELFSNSVRHSRSALPGETVRVAVTAADDLVRIEVTDRGGPGLRDCARRGPILRMGAGWSWWRALAAAWGWRRRRGRTVTWFAVRYPGGR